MKLSLLNFVMLMTFFSAGSFYTRGPESIGRSPASKIENESSHQFLFSDFGSISMKGLQNNTVPLKITITGLVLLGREEGWIPKDSLDYKTILKRFGFITPSKISNAEFKEDDFYFLPMGLTQKNISIIGSIAKVQGLNISCSACHAGRLYDVNGVPTDEVMLGIPNTSINFNSYLVSVFKGLNLYIQNSNASFRLLREIFPKTKLNEKNAIKILITRIVKGRLKKLNQSIQAPLPFSSGSPGVTNGVASLKFNLGIMNKYEIQNEYGFTSIPSLADRFLRTSLLYDGVYFPPGQSVSREKTGWTEEEAYELGSITASFTMPTMGLSAKAVVREREKLAKITRDVVSAFRTPKFPGRISETKLSRGHSVYQASCSSCHGNYELKGTHVTLLNYPNKLIHQEKMGTDPERWKAMDAKIIEKINSLDTRDFLMAQSNTGYIAPLLSSLWLTAPYLHNGSVPTLWHLMNPSKRPVRFLVGGHHLDFEKMGILLMDDNTLYPAHVAPHSIPEIYDTSLPGRSNKGHEVPFNDLNQEQKSDLLEFLKIL